MKNKLASFSISGRFTFDIDILNENINKLNEVVVHELLHLKYINHGKIFKIMLITVFKNTNILLI